MDPPRDSSRKAPINPARALPNPPRFCYVALLMTLLHENLPQAIEDLSARIIAIRDSL